MLVDSSSVAWSSGPALPELSMRLDPPLKTPPVSRGRGHLPTFLRGHRLHWVPARVPYPCWFALVLYVILRVFNLIYDGGRETLPCGPALRLEYLLCRSLDFTSSTVWGFHHCSTPLSPTLLHQQETFGRVVGWGHHCHGEVSPGFTIVLCVCEILCLWIPFPLSLPSFPSFSHCQVPRWAFLSM